MKKTVLFIVILSLLCATFAIPCIAGGTEYHWYCKHVKDHVQPMADPALRFVEERNGYYVDHKNQDPQAAEKVIYLTFDVGYENGNVSKILDVLQKEQVTSAFFILGNLIEKNADLVRRMVAEGHTVGNHSMHHKNMSAWEDARFLEEMHAMEKLYREVIGAEMSHYFRPPEGSFSENNLICADQNGYRTIFWSFAYPDWDNGKQMSAEKAKKIILDNAHNGEVMLLHPTSATNAAILGDVIRELKVQGYRFGSLDELTEKEG